MGVDEWGNSLIIRGKAGKRRVSGYKFQVSGKTNTGTGYQFPVTMKIAKGPGVWNPVPCNLYPATCN